MSASIVAEVPETPKRRRWRLGLAWTALFVIVLLIAADGYRRHQRLQWLKAEIRAAGGVVYPTPTLWERIRERRWNEGPRQIIVDLGEAVVDAEWLRKHDQLIELQIQNLAVTRLNGADAARLIAQHPLEEFYAWEMTGADDAARALRNCPTARDVRLSRADLTNDGLRALPLERLRLLNIERTDVTSDGLRDLARCKRLTGLAVDGAQAGDAVATLIETGRLLDSLHLVGELVTDEHLARLHELKLKRLSLSQTSTTDAGVDALKSRLPDCQIYEQP